MTQLTQNAQAVTMVSEAEATLQGRLQLAQVHLQACSSVQESMLLAGVWIQAPPKCISQASSASSKATHAAAGLIVCHGSA